MSNYLVWSDRFEGWQSPTGFTRAVAEAQRMTLLDAVDRCVRLPGHVVFPAPETLTGAVPFGMAVGLDRERGGDPGPVDKWSADTALLVLQAAAGGSVLIARIDGQITTTLDVDSGDSDVVDDLRDRGLPTDLERTITAQVRCAAGHTGPTIQISEGLQTSVLVVPINDEQWETVGGGGAAETTLPIDDTRKVLVRVTLAEQ